MKRVLCVLSEINQGGAETFIMKLMRSMDKSQYMIDFCAMTDIIGVYEKEIEALGGKIYHVTPKTKNPVKSFFDIRKVVKQGKYQYALRLNNHAVTVIDLLACRAGGAKRLIMRTTNSGNSGSFSIILHKILKFLPMLVPNVMIAPSKEAGIYTFGEKAVSEGKVEILQNGLDISEYAYNEGKRNELRQKLNISHDTFVLGHIGRFTQVKNHSFIIQVFKKLLTKKPDAKLLLIGKGELEEDIKSLAKEKGVFKNVIFAGTKSDAASYYSVMDALILPSLYEGMPNVVIEAQASGLKCVVSDTVTKQADITGLCSYLSLSDNIDLWVDTLLEGENFTRKDTKEDFIKAGYDIQSVCKRFIQLIFGE